MPRALERDERLRHAVKELLEERRQLLVAFCELAGAEPADAPALLQRFCQWLIDYSALWRFEIQAVLLDGGAELEPARKWLECEQRHILQADDAALVFNEDYDESEGALSLLELDERLSRLGEQLASRFDAEDRILSAL